jgi:hypothetical protein
VKPLGILLLALATPSQGALADDPALVPAVGSARERLSVLVEQTTSGPRCTIRADKAPVERIVVELAEGLELRVAGFEAIARTALVDVELVDRPVFDALDAILGSVGLRASLRPGAISVEAIPDEDAPHEELIARAMAAYLRATSRYPEHPLAARARLMQGGLEEERSNWGAALGHYEALVEEHGASEHAPEATLRAGMCLMELRMWDDAAERFRRLLALSSGNERAPEARFQLAHCALAQNDHERALQILNHLESSYPAHEEAEVVRRLVTRARALNGSGLHVDALRAVERAEAVGMSPELRTDSYAERARAFEGLELHGEASRAWLVHAGELTGEERQIALENAARLALQGGDELGVLFVYEQAAREGVASRLTPLAREARMRLGLDVGLLPGTEPVEERLDVAEQWLSRGEAERVIELITPLVDERATLEPALLVRAAVLLARANERQLGAEHAIRVLREARTLLDESDERRLLDREAASIFERAARFDEAIDAYQGRY